MIRHCARFLTGLFICLFVQAGLWFSVVPAQAKMPVMVQHHCSSHMVMPQTVPVDAPRHKGGEQTTLPGQDKCCSVATGVCAVPLPAVVGLHDETKPLTRMVFVHFSETTFTGTRCAPLLRPPRAQSFLT